MEKIAIENTTKMPIYVAGQMIPAGEIRHFNEDQVPAEYRPSKAEAPAPDEEDPIEALSRESVKNILVQIETLSDTDLDRLGELEQMKRNEARKTLLEAISAEILHRAEAKS